MPHGQGLAERGPAGMQLVSGTDAFGSVCTGEPSCVRNPCGSMAKAPTVAAALSTTYAVRPSAAIATPRKLSPALVTSDKDAVPSALIASVDILPPEFVT